MRHRGLQPDTDIESMKLLYFYGKYKKERETAAQPAKNPKVTKAY